MVQRICRVALTENLVLENLVRGTGAISHVIEECILAYGPNRALLGQYLKRALRESYINSEEHIFQRNLMLGFG